MNSLAANRNFNSAPIRLAAVRDRLAAWFASAEIDRDPFLKIICACLLLYFHLSFFRWTAVSMPLTTLANDAFDYLPSPLFMNLRGLIFMDPFQTQACFYVLGLLALLGTYSLFAFRTSLYACCTLALLLPCKLYFYLSDLRLFSNFHYFHILFTILFLIARDKMRFLRLALAVAYILSAVVKFSPSWLYGEYFNAVPGKLPLFPRTEWVVTGASLWLIFLEFFGPLVWFTRITWLRRLSFLSFIVFHVYSGFIVGLWYTTLMVPLVLAAFAGFNEPLLAGYRFRPRDWLPWGALALLLSAGCFHLLIPGDARVTSEGRYLGLFMFDAKREVKFATRIQKGIHTWEITVDRREGGFGEEFGFEPPPRIHCKHYQAGLLIEDAAVDRPLRDGDQVIFNPQMFRSLPLRIFGDPYVYFFYARELVRRYHPDSISLKLSTRLNDYPQFVDVVDIQDFVRLNPSYRCLVHNDWIKLPGTNSPAAYRWP